MTTSSVVPVQFRDPWHNPSSQPKSKAVAKPSDCDSVSLSLEVVKGIWRKYPKFDTSKAVEVTPSTEEDTNVLKLNLGTPSESEIISGGRMSRIPSAAGRSMNGEAAVSDSPTSERAVVDELLATASDHMDITSTLNGESSETRGKLGSESVQSLLLESEKAQGHHSVLRGQDDASQAAAESPSGARAAPRFSQLFPPITSRDHSINEVRSVLMDSFQKTVQLRYPDKDLDLGKLKERFAEKLSDSEVLDFARMGREVVDQLKHSGKLEEVKRKIASSDNSDVDGERRIRRRMYRNASPGSVEVPHTLDYGQDVRRDEKRLPSVSSHSNTPAQSDRSTRSARSDPPRAPRAMLINQRKDVPPLKTSTSIASRRSSTPRRDTLEQEPTTPRHSHDDVSMSMSLTPRQAPQSPRTSRPSLTPSNIGHDRGSSAPNPSPSHFDPTSAANQANDGPHPIEIEDEHMSTVQSVPIPPTDVSIAKILLAKVGLPCVDLLGASFDVDERLVVAARRWAQRSKHYDPSELHMRLYLMSIPTTAAETAHRELPPNSSLSVIAETIAQINIAWPSQGTLYVSLNKDRPEAKSWGDNFFTASSPPLDLSDSIVPGKNDIQFVQLADHSQRLFLVLAIPPSDAEKQEVLAMHSNSRRAAWNSFSHDLTATTPVRVKLRLDVVS